MDELYACDPDGTFTTVECSYEGIKQGMHGATIDFVQAHDTGFFVDDEGMLNGGQLNVIASMMTGLALYGPVVLCAGEPDRNGDTVPPPEGAARAMEAMAEAWRHVVADARRKGQEPFVAASADTLPMPTIIALPDDWLPGDPLPDVSL